MNRFELHPISTVPDNASPNREGAKRLVVVVHGILTSYEKFDPLLSRIEAQCENDEFYTDFWVPKLPWASLSGTVFGFGDLDTLLEKMRLELDYIWENGSYEEILFVGHSMGGTALRALYYRGWEVECQLEEQLTSDQKHNRLKRHWSSAQSADRMVLLAEVNRGFGATPLMGLLKSVGVQATSTFLNRIEGAFPHLVNTVRRDGDFISRLRLNWIEARGQLDQLTVVQLLGSKDDIVGPNDTLDLVTGRSFYYLDIANTGHGNILSVGHSVEDATAEETLRWEQIYDAFFASSKNLKAKEVRPWGLARPKEPSNTPEKSGADSSQTTQIDRIQSQTHGEATDVVFVIHGIRDPGHWTDKVARRVWKLSNDIAERGGAQRSLERVVESYGFFGMGPFLFPNVRRHKVNWLVERYIEARSKYPEARFHFIGHSHGTYVLAKMLELFPMCQFENVVFVGSVVRRDYPWKAIKQNGQVRRVLNFVATQDWVVAFFPRIFETWNIQDLGSAGHLGFSDTDAAEQIHSVTYAVGGHSAGREEVMWDAIANFVLDEPKDRLPDFLSQLEPNEIETSGVLENQRRGFLAHFIEVISPGFIFLACALLVIALGLVPYALVRWVAPSISFGLANPAAWTGWMLLAMLFLGAGSLFAATQKKFGRPYGALFSFGGAGALTIAAWLAWRMFPSIDAFAGADHLNEGVALQSAVGASLVIAWFLALRWALRHV